MADDQIGQDATNDERLPDIIDLSSDATSKRKKSNESSEDAPNRSTRSAGRTGRPRKRISKSEPVASSDGSFDSDESTQDEASRSAKSRDDSSERVDEQEAHDDADVQEDESERSHARRNGRDERSDRSGRGKRRGDRRKKDRRRDADSKHPGEPFDGMLELIGDKKFGFIREFTTSLIKGDNDPFMPPPIIQKHKLRDGVRLKGIIKPGRKGAWQVTQVDEVMGVGTDEWAEFTDFDSGVTIYPEEKLNLVTGPADVSMRVIDLVAPLGKGQRALIVAPPRAGKTVMLKQIAAGISDNHEEVDLVALLVDERPEEVTDFVRNTSATVFASSNDYGEDNHIRVATLAFEYSRRLVEMGRDVVILLDSLTRLGRTFNLWGGNSGRTMSGGLDARALVMPRKIFGAARNIENGGSLTIIATALVETGSRMDEVIFEEFKGTGNSEIVLDRELADKRIYPAINIRKSGTRNEERLISDEQIRQRHMLLRVLADRHPVEAMQALLKQIQRSPTNIHLLNELIPEQTY